MMKENNTWKEAILKALEYFPNGADYSKVWEKIKNEGLYKHERGKTPENTVSARLGRFITTKDERVLRSKINDKYVYYLYKFRESINPSAASVDSAGNNAPEESKKPKKYLERDLHPLFITYLRHRGILAKTIYHEKANKKDAKAIWTHPDIVGVKFAEIKNQIARNLYKELNPNQAVEIFSYELKREILEDADLKPYYFQAVSNSSWANYGYLVAFEINDDLKEEIGRLNAAFGIGVIKLSAFPFKSEVLFPAKRKEIEPMTLSKNCDNKNEEFGKFIEQITDVLTAEEKSRVAVLEKFERTFKKNDGSFIEGWGTNETDEIKKYCKEKGIPTEDWQEEEEEEEEEEDKKTPRKKK